MCGGGFLRQYLSLVSRHMCEINFVVSSITMYDLWCLLRHMLLSNFMTHVWGKLCDFSSITMYNLWWSLLAIWYEPAEKGLIHMIWLLLSISDWSIIMICPGGLLLVVPHLFAVLLVSVSVSWVELQKKGNN
jgi:hypothetical protein